MPLGFSTTQLLAHWKSFALLECRVGDIMLMSGEGIESGISILSDLTFGRAGRPLPLPT